MGIKHIEEAKSLRIEGVRLGRAGLSERVIYLVDQFKKDPSYKRAMALAGALKAITMATKFDDYWSEQVNIGFYREIAQIKLFQKPEDLRKEEGFPLENTKS